MRESDYEAKRERRERERRAGEAFQAKLRETLAAKNLRVEGLEGGSPGADEGRGDAA